MLQYCLKKRKINNQQSVILLVVTMLVIRAKVEAVQSHQGPQFVDS